MPPGTASIRVGVRFLASSTPPGGEPEPSGPGGGLLDNLSLRVSAPLPAARLVPPRSAVPHFDHVFMIMMENTNGRAVLSGHSHMPFVHSLMPAGRHAGELPRRLPPQRRELPGHRGRRHLRQGRHLLAGHQRPAPQPRRRARRPVDELEGLRAGHGLPVQRPRVHRVHLRQVLLPGRRAVHQLHRRQRQPGPVPGPPGRRQAAGPGSEERRDHAGLLLDRGRRLLRR